VQEESPWRLGLKSEEVRRSTVGRAQNNLRKEDSGSGKAGSGRPILLAAHRATFCSGRRMSGNGNFPAGYAQPQVLQPHVYQPQ
jgi:hypothetical protein